MLKDANYLIIEKNINLENKFGIIPLQYNHLDQIALIEKNCFMTPWSKKVFQEEIKLPNSVSFVAVGKKPDSDMTEVIGYILTRIFADEMEILNLALERSWRRQGIAKALLRRVINMAEENFLKQIFLEVRSGNIPAQNLYMQFNFSICGVRRRYYTDTGEDALVMKKILKGNLWEGSE